MLSKSIFFFFLLVCWGVKNCQKEVWSFYLTAFLGWKAQNMAYMLLQKVTSRGCLLPVLHAHVKGVYESCTQAHIRQGYIESNLLGTKTIVIIPRQSLLHSISMVHTIQQTFLPPFLCSTSAILYLLMVNDGLNNGKQKQ